MYVKILCDDRFDQDLTYQIEDEQIGSINKDDCEKCAKYSECQGWAKIFDKCGGVKNG